MTSNEKNKDIKYHIVKPAETFEGNKDKKISFRNKNYVLADSNGTNDLLEANEKRNELDREILVPNLHIIALINKTRKGAKILEIIRGIEISERKFGIIAKTENKDEKQGPDIATFEKEEFIVTLVNSTPCGPLDTIHKLNQKEGYDKFLLGVIYIVRKKIEQRFISNEITTNEKFVINDIVEIPKEEFVFAEKISEGELTEGEILLRVKREKYKFNPEDSFFDGLEQASKLKGGSRPLVGFLRTKNGIEITNIFD